ncbi:MAG TPA: arsenate reductase (glutaredoxin) [Candidatus Competibacteraceae bacterium]|nr:arsenate reductase (glutaredoxin) [Candidatus Competibacteraceae bacterium]
MTLPLDQFLYFHNPRCSKSRAALALLRERGVEPQLIDYLGHPPSEAEIGQLLALLGLEPRQLMRSHEPEYAAAGLGDPSLDRAALIRALHQYPKLIERPIFVANGKAVIGRPPERVLEIL